MVSFSRTAYTEEKERVMEEQRIGTELALTLTMLLVLAIAVLLIANLIGAIHVFG